MCNEYVITKNNNSTLATYISTSTPSCKLIQCVENLFIRELRMFIFRYCLNMYDLLAHVLSVDKNTANSESVYNKTFFWQIYTLI